MKEEYFNVPVACPVCGGSGWVWSGTQVSEKCTNCSGAGTIYAQMRVNEGHTSDNIFEINGGYNGT